MGLETRECVCFKYIFVCEIKGRLECVLLLLLIFRFYMLFVFCFLFCCVGFVALSVRVSLCDCMFFSLFSLCDFAVGIAAVNHVLPFVSFFCCWQNTIIVLSCYFVAVFISLPLSLCITTLQSSSGLYVALCKLS